jgi:2'-5' RNA ligase
MKNEGTARYFVGIELDRGVRSACAQIAARLRDAGFSAAFEGPEKLHITLAFLGNVPSERFAEFEGALRRAACAMSPFVLIVDRIGAFPHERSPRVVYIGARQQGSAFRNAAAIVRAEYARLGFAFKDDAVAHVTIARVKGNACTGPPPTIDVQPIPVPVSEIVLFESIFDPSRRSTRYEIAARASLEAGVDARCRQNQQPEDDAFGDESGNGETNGSVRSSRPRRKERRDESE